MAKYRPIYTKIWKDKDFLKLKKDEKLLFLYLISNELVNNSGIFELPISTIVFESGLPASTVRKLLGENLIKNIEYDMGNEIIFVVNARNYCAGGRPDQVEKGILSEFKQNAKTSLWTLFLDKYPQFKALFNGCPTVAQPLTNGSLPLPLPLKDLNNNKPLKIEKDWKTIKQEAFEKRWLSYCGKKQGKKAANRHWNASIHKQEDIDNYDLAIENYIQSVHLDRKEGFHDLSFRHGSTWFNDWQQSIPKTPPESLAETIPEAQEPMERVLGDPETEKLWVNTLEKIKAEILPESYETWFVPTFPRKFEDGLMVVAVPSQFIRKAMIENYRGLIEKTLESIENKPILVDFCIEADSHKAAQN